MQIRARFEGWVDELVDGAGQVAPGPGAWTLIGTELSLELGSRAVELFGFHRDCRLSLDVDEEAIRQVRAALLEILHCACYVVDTAEGRVTG